MDTLGTITPRATEFAETSQRTEAFERLRYLARSQSAGVLFGAAGLGKSELFSQLAARLKRDGLSVASINLNGVDAEEFPHLLSAALGLGLAESSSGRQLWSRLSDHAQGRAVASARLVCLLDHIDRADASVLLAIDRAMQLFASQSSWLFSARTNCAPPLKSFLRERSWLRVELKELTALDASRLLARELGRGEAPVRLSPDAMEFTLSLARGRMDRLRQLAELASLVAESESSPTITQEQLAAMTEELLS